MLEKKSNSEGRPRMGFNARIVLRIAWGVGALLLCYKLWTDAPSIPFTPWRTPTVASELDKWIEKEASFAWSKIFEQIGPPSGANEGLVIAAPTKNHPDYFYTWTRDSAIVSSTVFHQLLKTGDTSLESSLRLYAYSQEDLQHVCNPSGCFEEGGHGLGEPKFHVNGSAFTGDWGRPQRDGPALRAITLIGFAEYLLDRGNEEDLAFVKRYLYRSEMPALSVIKADLEYVSHYWHESSFDLWEEIDGYHFFTFIASRTALRKGAVLASRLNDPDAAAFYSSQAAVLSGKLGLFVAQPPNSRVVLASLYNERWNRTGLDAAVLLGILIANEPPTDKWGAASDEVLATVKEYVDSFRDVYNINHKEQISPIATGRYAEDIYDGYAQSLGNPWYLTTVSVPHVLSIALEHFWTSSRPIEINEVNVAFWQGIVPTAASGVSWESGSEDWKSALLALEKWSDGFWGVLERYRGNGGALAEQFNRNTGEPQGAQNLTWSYASFFGAAESRKRAKQSRKLA